MDAWLRDEANVPAAVENSKPEKKTKKKKKLTVAREAYEETSGVCTPSNPNFDHGISPKVSHCSTPGTTKLCSNSDLIVDFSSSPNPGSDEVVVKLGLLIPGPRRLKDIEANVVDTLNARMVRSEPGFVLPASLSPGEHGELSLHFALGSKTLSQTLRGTITYLVEEEDGSMPGKLDFRLPLRSTDSLLSVMISKNDFSCLLAGGNVDFSASAQFVSEYSFRDLLTKITFVGHFSVVEEVGSAASLYATTTAGNPVCVLLKKNEENVHIGCKTGDQKLADVVVEDLKDICTRR
ncbi:hypothetical protein OESDEN_19681 [Oesophagostomum dentatum]|uniref:AP-3 complex subunit delta Mu C-terminal domain-containing protein n=1 Tax=Oesophagostomum dentatum TaxID=61180 RepID=A0A0B1SBT3_OESDE|nr:hypothetical protein OESDEN_19681 [Oesophagostomum dentatum]